jgi:membrane fusion protein, multidrug efflux system
MRSLLFCGLIIAIVWVAGCRKKTGEAVTGGPPVFAVQAIVVEAKRQPISESLSLVGTIAANESVELKSETDGTVEEILFNEGQEVKQGDLLVRLDESKFSAAAAEAEANFKLSQANFDRAKQLYRDHLIAQQEFDQAAAQFQANQAGLDLKKRQLKDARIYAPFEGTMSSREISPGQVISKNTMLTWLVDLDPVKVEVTVPERYVGKLAVGQIIDVTVAAYPDRTFTGEVFFVAPFLDPVMRTALVKARIANPKHELKPGMFANLDLTLKLKESAVVIPESSIIPSGDRNVIYVVDESDVAQIRLVKLGIRAAGLVEIVSGLQGGERVVAEGIQKIRPGGKVKAVAPETEAGREGGKTGKRESEISTTGERGSGEAGRKESKN